MKCTGQVSLALNLVSVMKQVMQGIGRATTGQPTPYVVFYRVQLAFGWEGDSDTVTNFSKASSM